SSPNNASRPSEVPATLPTLNTRPPKTTRAAMAYPRPGRTRFPSSCARNPETPITRHTFNWTAMSTRIETRMAKAKAAPQLDGELGGLGDESGADGAGGHQENSAEQGASLGRSRLVLSRGLVGHDAPIAGCTPSGRSM